MLTIPGKKPVRFCDGVSRRASLQVGGLALGGLSLLRILRAQAAGSQVPSHKGIIMVYLAGGPPHQDMWEIKTEAPREIRGEFLPIPTSVPGIQICEQFPKLAKRMHDLVVIRSLVGCRDEHSPYSCYSGFTEAEFRQRNRPCLASFLSKLKGPVDRAVPPFASLSLKTKHLPWASPGDPGFLGNAHSAFMSESDDLANMTLNGIGLGRLGDRKALLSGLDRVRRDIDASGQLASVDTFTQQTLEVLTSSKLVDALDLDKENPKLRKKYGHGLPVLKSGTHPCEWHSEQFLVARRLIQAGVRCVTLNFSTWDSHSNNFPRMRKNMPYVDLGVAALVDDLRDQGMLDDVSVVVWGEFGRTPKINKRGGRDHWPSVSCALLAGGGIRSGQAIGSTNRLGEVPRERPIHYQEVFSTLYRNLGIDVNHTTVEDQSGRPQFLVDIRDVIPELV